MAELGDDGARLRYEVIEEGNGEVVVRLEGELDLSNTDELDAAMASVIREQSRLVVDVGGLRFADSSGISLWVRWAQSVPELELRNPSPLVRRVVETMGLEQVLGLS